MDDIMVLCKKCGSKVPASSLKLDLDEKKMVCPECIKNKKVHKQIQEEVFHKNDDAKKPVSRVFSPSNKENKEEEKPSKIGHKCASCGYKFMVNPETRSPKNCPYCNARILSF